MKARRDRQEGKDEIWIQREHLVLKGNLSEENWSWRKKGKMFTLRKQEEVAKKKERKWKKKWDIEDRGSNKFHVCFQTDRLSCYFFFSPKKRNKEVYNITQRRSYRGLYRENERTWGYEEKKKRIWGEKEEDMRRKRRKLKRDQIDDEVDEKSNRSDNDRK